MQKESDTGNIEYKLRLSRKDDTTVYHISNQMRYRTSEGDGEALYMIGVKDDGTVEGINDEDYKETFDILSQAAKLAECSLTLLNTETVDDKKIYEFLLRENNNQHYNEIRVACGGSVDSGKSSLLGVLLSGQNDNGRGLSRLNVFNFQHEITSGRTSSITQHILGFDSIGNVVNYGDCLGRKKTWPEIVKRSSKIVTLIDLCGHEKYLKTTITGLTSQYPDLCFIVVGANMGLTRITKEHIFLCLSLSIPFVIIVTKIDICEKRENIFRENVKEIKNLIKIGGIRRLPLDIKDTQTVSLAIKNINNFSIVPIFYVSNVTGQGIPYLLKFLNLYSKNKKESNTEHTEFHVDQTFHVAGVGLVVGGQLVKGKIKVGDRLLFGPNNGVFTSVQVKSIHCKRVAVDSVPARRYVCLGIKKVDNLNIVRGMVGIYSKPYQVTEFEAEIMVLKTHSTTIKKGYQPILHCSSIRQTAEIIEIKGDNILKTGDKTIVKLRFCYKPEYINIDSKILLAEGKIKIIGKVTKIYPEPVNIV